MLATVLFTDVVGSTERAVDLGDEAWRGLLERHNELTRRELINLAARARFVGGRSAFGQQLWSTVLSAVYQATPQSSQAQGLLERCRSQLAPLLGSGHVPNQQHGHQPNAPRDARSSQSGAVRRLPTERRSEWTPFGVADLLRR
jgi:hypothetical protein